MSSENWLHLIFLAFVLLYGGIIVGTLEFVRRRRKTRWPFKESEKLLRGPGEGLRREILKYDERFVFEFLGFIMTVLLAWPAFALSMKAIGLKGWPLFVGVMLGMLALTCISAWRVVGLVRNRSKRYLGWYGERMVAEKLRPLLVHGYRVFHDVPGEPGKKGFNLDHVVVGPAGVTVVEVKTRRKGNARPGYKDHEVSFDGTRLDWPWGYDEDDPQQAVNEADWLRKWLHGRTGLKLNVRAMVALPGWFVREAPSDRLRVVNPDFLPQAIRGRNETVLTEKEVDLIARQLDDRCRDVEE